LQDSTALPVDAEVTGTDDTSDRRRRTTRRLRSVRSSECLSDSNFREHESAVDGNGVVATTPPQQHRRSHLLRPKSSISISSSSSSSAEESEDASSLAAGTDVYGEVNTLQLR
jgi:hypothetical protein